MARQVSESNLKAQYEHWAADVLLSALEIKDRMEFVRHGDDVTEPDIIYAFRDHSLGIEVTTAYYSDKHALEIWDNASTLGEVLEGFNEPIKGIEDPDELICERIQHEINVKSAKEYTGVIETWLCIVEQAPLTDEASLKSCLANLSFPGSDFDAIYLLRRGLVGEHYYVIKLT
jgi:hypothetical protein